MTQKTSKECYIVVGAGQAGAVAVSSLRESGFGGRILLVGDEPHLPYERPPLSKEVLLTPATAKPTIFDSAFYSSQNIECRFGIPATHIDIHTYMLKLASGEQIHFDKLLLATGARARPYPLLDALGKDALQLRSMKDAQALAKRIQPGARILVVGGGVIGLEVAASARTLGAEVTLLERGDRLMARAAPVHLAQALLELHRDQGVRCVFDVDLVKADHAANGSVQLHSQNGEVFVGDLVVYGIGVHLNVELAQASGLKVEDGILIDEYGMTSAPGIYAAGDVARQWQPQLGRYIRQETWSNAQNQAQSVVRSMLTGLPCDPDLPWYWTDQYGSNIQVAGSIEVDEWVTRGNRPDRYTQFGLRDGCVVGAITFNNGKEMRPAKQLISVAAELSNPELLLDPKQDLRKLVVQSALAA